MINSPHDSPSRPLADVQSVSQLFRGPPAFTTLLLEGRLRCPDDPAHWRDGAVTLTGPETENGIWRVQGFGILVEYLEAGTDVLALATQNGMVIFLTSILRAPDPTTPTKSSSHVSWKASTVK